MPQSPPQKSNTTLEPPRPPIADESAQPAAVRQPGPKDAFAFPPPVAALHLADAGLAARVTALSTGPHAAFNPRRITLRTGARLYERGRSGDSLYLVESGVIKETAATADGERIVRLVFQGGITGLDAALGDPHLHTARVMHPGQALRIPASEVAHLLAHHADAPSLLLHEWHRAVQDEDYILSSLGQGVGRQRLARALLFLCGMVRAGESIRLRHDDLAQLLALNKVSIARLLGAFRRERLIQEKGRRCVGIDRLRMEAVASGRR